MREVLNIVPKKKSTGKKILIGIWLALTIFCLAACIFITPFLFMVPMIIFGVIWYWQAFQSDIEYEYTYYAGDLKFAMVKAKRKRKKIVFLDIENVLQIAPKGDRSVYKYENDNTVSCKKLLSGKPDTKIYNVIYRDGDKVSRIEFEPEEDLLDAIMVKYPRLVVK